MTPALVPDPEHSPPLVRAARKRRGVSIRRRVERSAAHPHSRLQLWTRRPLLIRDVSWGVILGLAYAQSHPERVAAMVLPSVTMTRRSCDIHWLPRDRALLPRGVAALPTRRPRR